MSKKAEFRLVVLLDLATLESAKRRDQYASAEAGDTTLGKSTVCTQLYLTEELVWMKLRRKREQQASCQKSVEDCQEFFFYLVQTCLNYHWLVFKTNNS